MNTDWIIETALPIATFVCGVFGVFGFFRSVRKPKARLRFANGKKKITFSPHYCRAISEKYYTNPPTDCYDYHAYEQLVEQYNILLDKANKFPLTFRLTNIGKLQLENYRVEIDIKGGKCKLLQYENATLKGVTVNKEKLHVIYSPSRIAAYLNQADKEDFSVCFIPDPNVDTYELHWRIIAKDCFKKGKLRLNLTPTVDEYDEIHCVNHKGLFPEGADVVKDLKPYIKPYIEKVEKLMNSKVTK